MTDEFPHLAQEAMRHSRHMRYTKADPPSSADAGLSDARELLVAAGDPKAAAHEYRQTASC